MNILIEDDIYNDMKALAKEAGTTVSSIARFAIMDYLYPTREGRRMAWKST